MPDTGLLALSVMCVLLGASCFMFPHGLLKFGEALNRTITVVDKPLMRYRYAFGVGLFVSAYLFFRLAVLLARM